MASDLDGLLEKLTSQVAAADDGEAILSSVRSIVTMPGAPLETVASQVAEALTKARSGGDRIFEANLLVATAEVDCAEDKAMAGLGAAEDAMRIFKEAGSTKGLGKALEAAFKAHAMQKNARVGLQVANKELEAMKQAKNKKGEVDVLEMLMQAHAQLGEPHSAITAATQALEGYRGLGDKEGEACTLHLIAEMRRVLGEKKEAIAVAKQSQAAFKAAGLKWGEEKCLATISSCMAEVGRMEKAPNRQEALKALKEFVKGVESKDAAQVKSAEDRLSAMRDCVSDQEIFESLSLVVQKDGTAVDFLKEQGWDMGGGGGAVQGYDGTYIKGFGHKAFYLQTLMTGMGFGPQFRGVNPYREGRHGGAMHALSVSQLPETESWQMDMGYRPGIMDSALQCQAVMGFP
mmetsp:Transcript_60170/g.176568  ORF Transcript_60170/g.176568 Transcript_60170/m.176568 type:complete len:404 (-) Transcript_60170:35-1246(-)